MYYRIYNILKAAGILLLIFIIGLYVIVKADWNCESYVEEMTNYGGIENLESYVSYDMFSSKLKKYIKKEDLKYSTDQEIWDFAHKLEQIDYKYDTDRKGVYSTEDFTYNPFKIQMEIAGQTYDIFFEIVFKRKIFSSKPKVVDFKASVMKIPYASYDKKIYAKATNPLTSLFYIDLYYYYVEI